jgi:hypothetical protein
MREICTKHLENTVQLEREIQKYGAAQYNIMVYPTKVGGAVGAKLRS